MSEPKPGEPNRLPHPYSNGVGPKDCFQDGSDCGHPSCPDAKPDLPTLSDEECEQLFQASVAALKRLQRVDESCLFEDVLRGLMSVRNENGYAELSDGDAVALSKACAAGVAAAVERARREGEVAGVRKASQEPVITQDDVDLAQRRARREQAAKTCDFLESCLGDYGFDFARFHAWAQAQKIDAEVRSAAGPGERKAGDDVQR